jgi:hypothetical protein
MPKTTSSDDSAPDQHIEMLAGPKPHLSHVRTGASVSHYAHSARLGGNLESEVESRERFSWLEPGVLSSNVGCCCGERPMHPRPRADTHGKRPHSRSFSGDPNVEALTALKCTRFIAHSGPFPHRWSQGSNARARGTKDRFTGSGTIPRSIPARFHYLIFEPDPDRSYLAGNSPQPQDFLGDPHREPVASVVNFEFENLELFGERGIEPEHVAPRLKAGVSALQEIDGSGHGAQVDALQRPTALGVREVTLQRACESSSHERSRSARATTHE